MNRTDPHLVRKNKKALFLDSYSSEVKRKCVELKDAIFNTKDIMNELNIRNRIQVDTWWRWCRNGVTHRFDQQVGKQRSYSKAINELDEVDRLKLEFKEELLTNSINNVLK